MAGLGTLKYIVVGLYFTVTCPFKKVHETSAWSRLAPHMPAITDAMASGASVT
jgi:hypothetical protein